jgi:hypothetical protein
MKFTAKYVHGNFRPERVTSSCGKRGILLPERETLDLRGEEYVKSIGPIDI